MNQDREPGEQYGNGCGDELPIRLPCTLTWIRTKDKLPAKKGYYTVSYGGCDWSWAYWNGDKWVQGPELDARVFSAPMYWIEIVAPDRCAKR